VHRGWGYRRRGLQVGIEIVCEGQLPEALRARTAGEEG
jgi:hypothetical protein